MIKVLDKIVSDKIAAGEVIERPISVVKELIENAIDSGATSIICEIKNGGKSYIRVTDNGCGISSDQVEVAFLRHATSKITKVSDLNSLDTLGFRGEALASIAAISQVELLTKTKDEKAGTSLLIHGGNVVSKKSTGCPDGTTIIVNDIFYNTPARLKFLKNDGSEGAAISQFISEVALAYSNVQFRFINNGTIVFSTAGKGNRLSTIANIFPGIDIKNLVPLFIEEQGIRVEGYISTPAMTKPTRNSQIFFVNGRVIDSNVIEKGLKKGYRERLFEGRHPVSYIFITIPPNTLDVNIHPNKRQVRFDDDQLIIQIIEKAVFNALSTKESVVRIGESKKPEQRTYIPPIQTQHKQIDIKELLLTNYEETKVEETKTQYKEIVEEKESSIIHIAKAGFVPFDFANLDFIGTIFNTYILAKDEDSFYMFDQHACHERINYEKFVNEYNDSTKHVQPIMIPFIINTGFDTSMESNWINALLSMGYDIEEFGYNSFRIVGIPTFMTISEAELFINDFIDNVKDDNLLNNTVIIDKLIMKSCKASIKANDKITLIEIQGLMDQLSKCINPFSCPHGRPTFIKMTKYEIERNFKRV